MRTLYHRRQIFVHRPRIQPEQNIHAERVAVNANRVFDLFAVVDMIPHRQKMNRLVALDINFHQPFVGNFLDVFFADRAVLVDRD